MKFEEPVSRRTRVSVLKAEKMKRDKLFIHEVLAQRRKRAERGQSQDDKYMRVQWADWRWLEEAALDENLTSHGVYMIVNAGEVLYIDRGAIGDRLIRDVVDRRMLHYQQRNVTWAEIRNEEDQVRVERYLTAVYKPTVAGNHTQGSMLVVNLPLRLPLH